MSRDPEARGDDSGAEPADARRVAAYLDGQDEAFHEVHAWIRREIEIRYPILRRECEDLCQMVHEKLLEKLRAGRFQHRSTLRSYVAGITHHTSINRIRELYRERALSQGWEARANTVVDGPYRNLAAQEERQLLHRVVQASSAACRSLWRMVFVERLSYEQIGQRLSIPPGTVKSRAWHCRKKALALLDRLQRIPPRGSR